MGGRSCFMIRELGMSTALTIGIRFAVPLAAALGATELPARGQAFEVVSIREVPRDAPPLMRDVGYANVFPGGQFADQRITLSTMIIFAFDIPSYTQLTGVPGWAKDQAFSVSAKPPETFPLLSSNENREQVRLMVREMLASRFNLKMHTESREERGLKLEVTKGGLKMKAVDPPLPPEKEGFVAIVAGDSGGRMIGKKVTMTGVASSLTTILRRPVFDETGLKSYYSFDVKWSAPEPEDGRTSGLGTEGVGTLMHALEDLFGFRLTSGIRPINYWVLDHVERPTPN